MDINCRIGNEAVQFLRVAEICAKELNEGIDKNGMLFIPVIVNTSFSIELFLKSFLEKEKLEEAKKIKKGHSLDYLLKQIEDNIKMNIIRMTISRYSRPIGSNISEKCFWDEMRKISNSFEKWRYYYESSKNLNWSFLYSLATSLNDLYQSIINAYV